MPVAFDSQFAASFGVRQAAVVSRMRAAVLSIQTIIQSEYDQLATAVNRAKTKPRQEIFKITRSSIDAMVQRVEKAISAHLTAAAQWGYSSSVDSLLSACGSEQLSWIALGKILNSQPAELEEHDRDRFTMANARGLIQALKLSPEVLKELAASAKSMGASSVSEFVLKLMNSFPPTVPTSAIGKLIATKIKQTSGKLPPSVMNDVGTFGGGTGQIQLGTPANLAQWWQSGFHLKTPDEKRRILKDFVFDPPTAQQVKAWTEKPLNVFGNEGMNWRDRLTKTSKLITNPDQMSDKISKLISQGHGIDGVMKSILPDMNNYKVSAQRVARMEVNRVCAEANERVYEQCDNVIAGMQMNATMDAFTRSTHAARNGKIWWKGADNYDKRPSLPDDFNCRCYYSPVIKPPKEISANPDLLKAYQTQAGPVMDPIIYGQWFDKANDFERHAVVGARRYHLVAQKLGSGMKPQFSDFIDREGNLRSTGQIQKASAQEILAWRADNNEMMTKYADQLTQVRTQSFISPATEKELELFFLPKEIKPTKSAKPNANNQDLEFLPDLPDADLPEPPKAVKKGKPPSTKTQPIAPAPIPEKKPPAKPPAPAPAEKTSPKPHKANTAPIVVKPPKGFPENTAELKVIQALGGSTGAQLVQDAQGRKWVMKKGGNEGAIREEFAAEQLYRAAGVAVPDSHLYESGSQPIKLSAWIEGTTYGDLSSSERSKAAKAIQKGYAVDALLGSWDVVGASGDNVIVDKSGKVWRIDVGGAMRFRAQGQAKTEKDWNAYPTELWTMQRNLGAFDGVKAEVFEEVNHDEKIRQMRDVLKLKGKLLSAANPENQEILKARLEQYADIVQVDETLKQDQWNEEYRSHFTEHTIGYRNEGISQKLPKKLARRKGSEAYSLKDSKGKAFDDLRGKGRTKDVQEYIEANSNHFSTLENYFDEQSGDSWNSAAQAFKYAFVQMRNVDPAKFWWKKGVQTAANVYKASEKYIKPDELAKLSAMYHAWTYETLRKVDLPHKSDKGITLVRTHDKDALKYSARDASGNPVEVKKGKQFFMKEGPLESCSLTNAVVVHGDRAIRYRDVPLIRVFGWYGMDRNKDGQAILLGDRENEFVTMLDGLPCEYLGETYHGEEVDDI